MIIIQKASYNVKKIVLVGIKHAGKSSVGIALSKRIALPFIDGDNLIMQTSFQQGYTHKTVRDLYKAVGKQVFRNIEKESLKNLPATYVFASGGGIAECLDVWKILEDTCIIFLKVSAHIAWERIKENSTPAFLEKFQNPFEEFKKMSSIRSNEYEKNAHIICNVDNASINAIEQAIANSI